MRVFLLRLLFFSLACGLTGSAAARTIEFETTEVTAADVALSPDGQWLIFTMLGHLFRLPVAGGTAEQLTFGPYYDFDPVFSPDGTRVAFVSDRDGSEGNVFVLELATGQITQVTHEPWVGRPTWTPDGRAIVYLRFVREAFVVATWHSVPALVRRVSLPAGEPETLSAPPRLFRSVFYLHDGRLAWTVIEPETGSPRLNTRIEVMGTQGTVSTLRALAGYVDRVVASPTGHGLYCRRYLTVSSLWFQSEDLLLLPLPEGAEQQIGTVSSRWPWNPHPRFAAAVDNKTLYVGDSGRLWKIALPSGRRQLIPFRARVKLEIQDPVPPPKPASTAVGSLVPLRAVMSPRLSPDGRRLVFGAAGYLWEQSLDGGQAQRLFEGSAFERDPVFSPDGKQLAFVRDEYGKQELRVFSFESQQTRTLTAGLSYSHLSWSRDGQRLSFVESGRLVAVNLGDGKKEELAKAGRWSPRPHFSADGQSLYFSANGTLYRLPLKEKAKPEPITQLARHLMDGLVSPDGKWLAFRRNTEIWVARLGEGLVKDEDVRRLNPAGGETFAFTPDGSAVIYAAGNRVWRHPLTGGEREEIPIRLELKRPTPPPLLVRRVRVLDFPPKAGGFGPETSLFIEQGRIRWIGSERGHQLPASTVILDAGGRFAIPGLFDLHAHIYRRGGAYQGAFLAYGVTSIRVPGAWHTWLNALADRSETTSDPLPGYFWGDFFEGAQPFLGDADILIYDEDDAQTYVRRSKEWGAHFIKVYPSLLWPLQRAVAEEARRQGLPVVGHGMSAEEITKSVTLGYAVLEHGTRPFDDILQMLALAGTRWDPTLSSGGGGTALLLRDEPERLGEAKFQAFIPEACIGDGWTNRIGTKALRGSWVEELASVRAAHRHGVKLQAGTDFGCFYGASLHWELEHFVEAGIPPLEVLRIATQEAAVAVGAEDHLGTLEPAKLADLILLDANPLEDIRNTQTIWRVIKGGWLFDPDELRPPAETQQE